MDRIRVGAVSYLNTKPLVYGIHHHPVYDKIELIEDYPSRIAGMLLNNEIDIGLVPVAVIPKLPEYHIETDYCIGCDGAVASVCIFSDEPIDQLTTIYLDYQSRTSVMLARVLLKQFWKSKANLVFAKGEEYRDELHGQTGGLVIGDRALEQRQRSKYIYDLGEAWKQYTGLPFVFAAWVSNKKLPAGFVKEFNEANKQGIEHIPQVLNGLDNSSFPLLDYFTKFIDYRFDDQKKQGLSRFLEEIRV